MDDKEDREGCGIINVVEEVYLSEESGLNVLVVNEVERAPKTGVGVNACIFQTIHCDNTSQ